MRPKGSETGGAGVGSDGHAMPRVGDWRWEGEVG